MAHRNKTSVISNSYLCHTRGNSSIVAKYGLLRSRRLVSATRQWKRCASADEIHGPATINPCGHSISDISLVHEETVNDDVGRPEDVIEHCLRAVPDGSVQSSDEAHVKSAQEKLKGALSHTHMCCYVQS